MLFFKPERSNDYKIELQRRLIFNKFSELDLMLDTSEPLDFCISFSSKTLICLIILQIASYVSLNESHNLSFSKACVCVCV